VTDQANSGAFLYLLLLNPVATFYVMINSQAGDNQVLNSLNNWFGPHPDNFIMNNWVLLSILIQLLLAVMFIFIAIKGISQSKRKRIRKK
jgi:membrane-associated PAP2 superfamily phosphatase